MKELLLCWWRRMYKLKKISALIIFGLNLFLFLFMLPSLLANILIGYAFFGNIPFDKEIFLFLLVLFLGDITLGDITLIGDIIKILRFKKIFGFLPPTTKEGMDALQFFIDGQLKYSADILKKMYAEEKNILSSLSELANPSIALTNPPVALDLERELRNLRKTIKRQKGTFYLKRKIAMKVGFEAEDFKGYTEEN